MKELYTSPEAELLRFAPAENLANSGDIYTSTEDADGDGIPD